MAHLLPEDVVGKDQLAMLRGGAQTLRSMVASDRGTAAVLAVDDAQWLDSGSAALVHRAATVADVRVVLTVRQGVRPPDVIARLASRPGAVDVALEALTEGQIETLLAQTLDGPVVRSSARRLARLSEGNPLWLRELVRGARGRGALTRGGGLWRLDDTPIQHGSLPDEVRATTGTLDPGVREVIAAVALADVVGVDVLESLFGSEVLAAADARGLLTAVHDRRRVQVRLSHPLYGETVIADLPPLLARALRLRLAEAVAVAGGRRRHDLLRMARWRLNAGDRSHPDLLTAAAHAAGAVLAHRLAERFARAAVEAGAGFATHRARRGAAALWQQHRSRGRARAGRRGRDDVR